MNHQRVVYHEGFFFTSGVLKTLSRCSCLRPKSKVPGFKPACLPKKMVNCVSVIQSYLTSDGAQIVLWIQDQGLCLLDLDRAFSVFNCAIRLLFTVSSSLQKTLSWPYHICFLGPFSPHSRHSYLEDISSSAWLSRAFFANIHGEKISTFPSSVSQNWS